MNGKHHPAPESVGNVVVFPLNGQTGFNQKILVVTGIDSRFGKSVPFVEAVTELKFQDDIITESPFAQITQTDGFSVDMMVEGIGKVFLSKFMDQQHAFAVVAGCLFLVAEFAFAYFNVVFFGQKFQGFVVRKLLLLHDEMHRITSFAAPETFENSLGWRNGKRRRFFIVKRTQTDHVHPAPAQCNVIGHHIDYLCSIVYPVYGSLVNH